jgi:uncharacterized cupin superfamily protein
VTIVELEPDARGKEHDHADDDHEEVYVVVEGEVDVDCDGETVTLGSDEAIRLSPDQPRTIVNRGEERATRSRRRALTLRRANANCSDSRPSRRWVHCDRSFGTSDRSTAATRRRASTR